MAVRDLIALALLSLVAIYVLRHLKDIAIFVATVLLGIAEVKDKIGLLGFLMLLAILTFCIALVWLTDNFVVHLLTSIVALGDAIKRVLLPRGGRTKKHLSLSLT